jgi:beta-lactamase regulating signal transducer with metallopeptidase domain
VLPGLSVPVGASLSPQVVTAGKADVFTVRPTQAAERRAPQPRSPASAAVLQKPLFDAEAPVVTPPAAVMDRAEPLPWAAWALIAWLAGAAAVAVYLAVGTVSVWAMVRRARRVEGGPWGELMESLCRQFGLARPVRLAVSEQAIIPVAWGFVRPVVLIPRAAEKWPEDRRRIILLHELAHVKRRDCLTQTLALAACVLYWFNPLAWLAARRLRIEREGACDDLVLAAGSPPADYAGHLLEIVRTLRPAAHTPLAAVAMAQRSHFESRLRAILDVARNRRAINRRVTLLAVVLGGCLLVPLAACQPQASKAAQQDLRGKGAAADTPAGNPPVAKTVAPEKGEAKPGSPAATPPERAPGRMPAEGALLGMRGFGGAPPAAPTDVSPARFEATVYEVQVPADLAGKLDSAALSAKAADPDALRAALAEFGPTKVLYRVDQPVNVFSENITIESREPMVVNVRKTDTGQSIRTVQYMQLGLTISIAAGPPPKESDRKGFDVRMRIEVASLGEGSVELTPQVKSPVFRNVSISHSSTLQYGRPFVILNVTYPTKDEKASATVFVMRTVFSEIKP